MIFRNWHIFFFYNLLPLKTNKKIINGPAIITKNSEISWKNTCEPIRLFYLIVHLKLTEACQTKARRKNRIGIIGKVSTKGLNGAYASGNLVIIKFNNNIFIVME